jgi:hypothetical protein
VADDGKIFGPHRGTYPPAQTKGPVETPAEIQAQVFREGACVDRSMSKSMSNSMDRNGADSK